MQPNPNAPSDSRPCWQYLCQQIALAWPPSRWLTTGVVVACSGGADSVALLSALCHLRFQQPQSKQTGFLIVAHFNHRLRGEEADGDEQFVRQLATQFSLRCIVGHAPDETAKSEESLRKLRLRFLQQTAELNGARYVAVGHSSDDNVETVLHQLFRGTGPTGLSGIAPHRSLGQDVVMIRPMMTLRREEIRDGLQSIGQQWREDCSNLDPSYRRNWIRHVLLPLVTSEYPQAPAAINRASESLRQWRRAIESMAQVWRDQHVTVTDAIDIRCDAQTPEAIVIMALQQVWAENRWPLGDMTMDHWNRLYQCVCGGAAVTDQLPGSVTVVQSDSGLRLMRS